MDIAPINLKTGYLRWMKSLGLPIHTGHGIADLRGLEVAPDARMGGRSAFLHLHGMQASPAATSARFRQGMRSNRSGICMKR